MASQATETINSHLESSESLLGVANEQDEIRNKVHFILQAHTSCVRAGVVLSNARMKDEFIKKSIRANIHVHEENVKTALLHLISGD